MGNIVVWVLFWSPDSCSVGGFNARLTVVFCWSGGNMLWDEAATRREEKRIDFIMAFLVFS